MHITVQKSGQVLTQLNLQRCSALIGSDPSVAVSLPLPTIPKRQAMLTQDAKGYWYVEDLGSGGGTMLNGNPVRRARLRAGDRIDIGPFRLLISSDKADSLSSVAPPTPKLPELPETAVVRYPEDVISARAAAVSNIQDITARLLLIDNQQQMLKEVLDCLLASFVAVNAWIGLRTDMKAPIAISAGRSRTERTIDDRLLPPAMIGRALDYDHAVLIPRMGDFSSWASKVFRFSRTGSAMSAPVRTLKGTIGAIYVDNAGGSTAYSETDLDQFILLANHIGAAVNRMVAAWSAKPSRTDRLVGSAEQVGSLLKPLALPGLPRCAIQAAAYPGRGEGTDCHDVRAVDDNILTAMVANTNHHDAQALACLSALRGAFAVWSGTELAPAELLQQMNANFLSHQEPCPIAALVARLNFDTAQLDLANAGNQPAYLLNKSSRLDIIAAEDVVPLGLDQTVTFTNRRVSIEPGQSFILWTKGLITARNAQRDQYGLERFTRSVEENFGRAAPDMLRDLWQDLRDFMGQTPQRNPMTLVVIQPTLGE